MKLKLFLVTLASVALLAAGGAPVTPDQEQAGQQITPEVLRAHTRFLSSDLLEGRGPATRGDSLAEAYIQSQMEALSLQPGAPGGGWMQKVPLIGIKPSFAGPAIFRSEQGTESGVPGENLVAGSGVQAPQAKVEDAEIVFVGYGIVAPEYQ